jgi:glycosyltransferase involved in cell wall biosynthesis
MSIYRRAWYDDPMIAKHTSTFRIGIDARFYRQATGGLGRYTRELIRHLAIHDTVNEYYVFLTEPDLAEWDLSQPNFHPVVVKEGHYSIGEQTRFLATLYKHKLDLVHFLNFNHPILYRRPFIVTLHDFTLFHFPAGRSKKSLLRRQAFVSVMRNALRHAKRVVAISEHTAQEAVQRFKVSHAKIEVIYEGGPEPVEPQTEGRAAVREYLHTQAPYFLFVSQWRPHKGIITALQAFQAFKERTGLPHKLVLAGNQKAADAEVREALSKTAYPEDVVTPGFVPEALLPALYSWSTALVMPSEYEGFGLPVLEAFACQAPVIVAKNTSLTEVGGDAVLYFPTRDAGALAEAMQKVAESPEMAQELVRRGLQQLRAFSWSRMAQQTHALYRTVLEKQR